MMTPENTAAAISQSRRVRPVGAKAATNHGHGLQEGGQPGPQLPWLLMAEEPDGGYPGGHEGDRTELPRRPGIDAAERQLGQPDDPHGRRAHRRVGQEEQPEGGERQGRARPRFTERLPERHRSRSPVIP